MGPITVKNGGQILNGDGSKNEKQAWGKPADWRHDVLFEGCPLAEAKVKYPLRVTRNALKYR